MISARPCIPGFRIGPVPALELQRAKVTVQELLDGPLVTIEYADGHVVRMMVHPDSIVLRMHLGIDKEDGATVTPITPPGPS